MDRRGACPYELLFSPAGWLLLRFFFKHGELDFLFHGIDAVDQDPDAIAQAVSFSRALADNLAGVFVIGGIVKRIQRDEPFDEKVGEFDKEAEFGNADDESVEIFSDAALHEFHFFPFHQSAFGFIGAAFGLAGFVGDIVEFVERDRAAERVERFLMGLAIAPLGPRWSTGVVAGRLGGWSARESPALGFLIARNSRSAALGMIRVTIVDDVLPAFLRPFFLASL